MGKSFRFGSAISSSHASFNVAGGEEEEARSHREEEMTRYDSDLVTLRLNDLQGVPELMDKNETYNYSLEILGHPV